MRNNPFLKSEQSVIKKVYGNTATLHVRIAGKRYNPATGEIVDIPAAHEKTIYIKSPKSISDMVVDGKNYIKGDLVADAAYLELSNAVGGIPNSGRQPNGRNAGIDITSDMLEFDGAMYRIVRITPKSFYAGTPTLMTMQLRDV